MFSTLLCDVANMPILEMRKMTNCHLPKVTLLVKETGLEPRCILILKLVLKSFTFIALPRCPNLSLPKSCVTL